MDSVWNGEGFDFGGPPAYFLIEVSNLLHGLTGDMLGSGTATIWRGMLFGMTQRDAVYSQAMWRTWDAVAINATDAVFGWWDATGPAAVNVSVSVSVSAAAADVPAAAPCSYNVSTAAYYGSHNEDCLPPSGPTPGCWLTAALADVQAACCADAACAGFSFAPASGAGCCKSEVTDRIDDPNYSGYRKVGWVPPVPANCVLATTWSSYTSHSIIVVANFCGTAVNATLALAWEELGLDAATAVASLPNIDGVQAQTPLPAGPRGPFELGVDGGLLMLVAAPGADIIPRNS